MLGSWRIGRPFGIDLSIHGTFWILPLLALIGGWMSHGILAAIVDAALILVVFGCVALHEIGHALAARWYGIRTRDITLYPIGGVARLDRIPERPWPEIVIALAGPAVNVVIAAAIGLVLVADGWLLGIWPTSGHPVNGFLYRVVVANLVLVGFNLIPAFPMDGGRVFRAAMSWFTDRVTATNIAARVGAVFAVLFGILAIYLVQPIFFILAIALYLMGRQEAEAVRRAAQARRWTWGVDEIPTFGPYGMVRNPYQPNVWVYDADTGKWTENNGSRTWQRFRIL
jgi:Zn-dependent protease